MNNVIEYPHEAVRFLNDYKRATKEAESTINDFLLGQQDCLDGVAHKMGMSESYARGYSTQYALEQVLSHARV